MNIVDSIKNEIKGLFSQVEVNSVEFYASIPYNENDPGADKMYFRGSIYKTDDEKQIVYGFASVIEVGEKELVDKQGDVIDEDTLIEAAHKFMTAYRSGKVMHKGEDVGEVVESVVFTKELQKALGIDLGLVGWFVGYKVHKSEVWDLVKEGKLSMFSIGGEAIREEINE